MSLVPGAVQGGSNLFDYRGQWVSALDRVAPLPGQQPPWYVLVDVGRDVYVPPGATHEQNDPTCELDLYLDSTRAIRNVPSQCLFPVGDSSTGLYRETFSPNLGELQDGLHTVTAVALDADGTAHSASFQIKVDNTRPSEPTVVARTGWQRGSDLVTSTTNTAGPSAVAGQWCTIGQASPVWYPGTRANITVSGDGRIAISCTPYNGAGVAGLPAQATAMLDNSAPTGTWKPIQWLTDPRHIVLNVSDADSGVVGGQISLTWPDGSVHAIPTTFDPVARTLTGFVDDDTLQAGTYGASAVVTDNVGNSATISNMTDGTPLFVPIPLRTPTELLLDQTAKFGKRCGRAPRHKRRRCAEVAIPAGLGPLTLASGQLGSVSGVVRNAGGRPLAGVPVEISAAPTGWASALAATVTTGPSGTFQYTLPPGPSRSLIFSFPGSDTLHDATARTVVRVRGRSTFRMNRRSAAPGSAITFSGLVSGGYIPPGGALVQLQFKDFGVWNQFGPVIHTDRRGRWRSTRRLQPGAALQTYEFQAVLVRENGWPFLPAKTRAIPFTVM